MTLADTISDWLIADLKAQTALAGADVIRAGDNSADRGPYIVVVDTSDEGGYDGIPGNLLENARVAVAVLTHTTDDPDGSQAAALKSAVSAALWAMQETYEAQESPEWYVRYVSPWHEGPVAMDGAYRRVQFTANLICQNSSI